MMRESIHAGYRHPFDFSKHPSHPSNSWHPHNFYRRIENTSRTSFPFETRWTKTYGVAGTGGDIRRKWGPTRRSDRGDQQVERRQGITNVSVGHMWIPRGLIRPAGPLIYAIVNPVKLCHKYRLMPPLRPADVITAEPALHNFHSLSSPSPFSQYSFYLASRSRGTCPSFRCIFRAPTVVAAATSTARASRALSFFFSSRLALRAHPRARNSESPFLPIPSRRRANPFTV